MNNSNQNQNLSIEEIQIQMSISGFVKVLELIFKNPSKYFIKGLLFRLRRNQLPMQSDIDKISLPSLTAQELFFYGAEQFDEIFESEREESELLLQEVQDFQIFESEQHRERPFHKINQELIDEIARLMARDMPIDQIAERLNINKSSIYRLKKQNRI